MMAADSASAACLPAAAEAPAARSDPTSLAAESEHLIPPSDEKKATAKEDDNGNAPEQLRTQEHSASSQVPFCPPCPPPSGGCGATPAGGYPAPGDVVASAKFYADNLRKREAKKRANEKWWQEMGYTGAAWWFVKLIAREFVEAWTLILTEEGVMDANDPHY